ncbi:FAD-dependent thymidylate synthase, partial [Patescibacteria group bacterium]|nr:FAD-dependent thymidylate synthase [Patescibacteria group bacterium]
MNKNKRRIYCLKGLSEETLAVCFAKCSRSSETFDGIARELSDEKSGKFHEKWVVGYGHNSVAEHAVIRLAIENVSLLAVEWIQDNRLASYTEKSSRYQIYDKNRYIIPKDIQRDNKALRLYKNAIDGLLDAYHEMIGPLEKYVLEKCEGNTLEAKVRGMCMDQARFLLPAGMMANLGMTANARVWEYAISKWLSSGIDEVVDMAKEVKKEVEKSCPVLVKYAAENKYLKDIYFQQITNHKLQITKNKNKKPVRVVDWDRDALDKIVASLIYKSSFGEYAEIKRKLKSKSKEYKVKILKKLLRNRTEHDRLPRDFEHIYISFDVLCDQGAYYDFKRNRMMTQIRQDLGVENGYMMPKMIKEVGMDKRYDEV